MQASGGGSRHSEMNVDAMLAIRLQEQENSNRAPALMSVG
jgi:hypothetical protein